MSFLPAVPYYVPGDLRVMPIGDSITVGFGGLAGYRFPLWLEFMNSGNPEIDLVGSSTQQSPPFVPDQQHEGHSGWRIADVLAHSGPGGDTTIESILTDHKTDVILLHVGTNNLFLLDSWQNAPDDMAILLDRIATFNPRILVVMALILPTLNDPVNLSVEWMNRRFHEVAYAAAQSGHNVQVVDMTEACPVLTTGDGVHPDFECYGAMAVKWREGIQAVGQPVLPPAPLQPLIAGATAVADTTEFGYDADLAVNGVGIAGTLHDAEIGSPLGWCSAPFDQIDLGKPGLLAPSGTPETFTVTLPAAHDVVQLEIWNGRTKEIVPGLDWKNVEAIARLGVEVSADGVVWVDQGELELVGGPPRLFTPPQIFDVNWPAAVSVRFTILETIATIPNGQTSLFKNVALAEIRLRGLTTP